MEYTICGIPIPLNQALRIAQSQYNIIRDFPTGNRAQDSIDLHDARERLVQVQSDILENQTEGSEGH